LSNCFGVVFTTLPVLAGTSENLLALACRQRIARNKKLGCGGRRILNIASRWSRFIGRIFRLAVSHLPDSSSWQHIDRIFRHLPISLPFDAFSEEDPLELSG